MWFARLKTKSAVEEILSVSMEETIPDIFARKRLTNRATIVMIAQSVSLLTAGSQIFSTLKWEFESQESGMLVQRSDCSEGINKTNTYYVNATACCVQSEQFQGMVKTIISMFKRNGLSEFITVMCLSVTGFSLTLGNYITFIKRSSQRYLRKIVLNITTFAAFITQVISCATFYEGIDKQLRESRNYCVRPTETNEEDFPSISYCVSRAGMCPITEILYGSWVATVVSTVAILVVTLCSCKRSNRVFKKLAEELVFRRKPVLHSLQRLMIRDIKTDLQSQMESERMYVDALQLHICEISEWVTSAKTVCNDEEINLEELPDCLNALKEYDKKITALLDNLEIYTDLRTLDLKILRDFVRYTSLQQNIPASLADKVVQVAIKGKTQVNNGNLLGTGTDQNC